MAEIIQRLSINSGNFNPGFSISVRGGARVTLTSHFGIDLNVSLQRLQFNEVPRESNISGDIKNYLLNGSVGLYLLFSK